VTNHQRDPVGTDCWQDTLGIEDGILLGFATVLYFLGPWGTLGTHLSLGIHLAEKSSASECCIFPGFGQVYHLMELYWFSQTVSIPIPSVKYVPCHCPSTPRVNFCWAYQRWHRPTKKKWIFTQKLLSEPSQTPKILQKPSIFTQSNHQLPIMSKFLGFSTFFLFDHHGRRGTGLRATWFLAASPMRRSVSVKATLARPKRRTQNVRSGTRVPNAGGG
jgi:hypothetical protein